MDCLLCKRCENFESHSWRYRCQKCNCPNYRHKSFVQKRMLNENHSDNWMDNVVSTTMAQIGDYIDSMSLAVNNNFIWIPIGVEEENITTFVERYNNKLKLQQSESNRLGRQMLIAHQIPIGDCNTIGDTENVEETETNSTSVSEKTFKQERDCNYFGFGEVEEVDTSEVCLKCLKPYDDSSDFCVRITHSGTASWHISCFTCSKCLEPLVNFHYYWNREDNSVYCMRHFDDIKSVRCGSCDGLIFDKDYTTAMEENHHVEHFTCIDCDGALTGQKFIQKDEKPFCVACYEKKFAHVCDRCSEVIGCNSKDLIFETRHWHDACFFCDNCKTSLVDQSFAAKDKDLYCPTCFDDKFGVRCTGCGQTFKSGVKKFEYGGKQWHGECFRCGDCNESIGSKSFIPKNDKTLCIKCYEDKYAQKCSKCSEIIRKGGVTYKCQPWHKECFICTNCNKELANTKFTSKEDKPYCGECFSELFSKRCKKCEKPISGFGGCKFISLEDEHWHTECFACARCEVNLVGKGFMTHNQAIMCAGCGQVEPDKV